MQIDALASLLPEYGIDPERVPPEVFIAGMQGTALLLLRQEALGIDSRASADDAIAALVDDLEARRAR